MYVYGIEVDRNRRPYLRRCGLNRNSGILHSVVAQKERNPSTTLADPKRSTEGRGEIIAKENQFSSRSCGLEKNCLLLSLTSGGS